MRYNKSMNIFSKLYCRTAQSVLRLVLPFMPYRAPKLLDGFSEAAEIIRAHNGKRALIVTGKNVRGHGLLAPLEGALTAANLSYEIFDGTPANPTISAIEEAASLYRKSGCDCVIAVGGGSPMDCAKGVCARVASPKKSVLQMKGVMKVKGRPPLLIAAPTTAGSGSEATVAAVVTDDKTHHKFTILAFSFVPKYAILDPSLTRTLPPASTAETGLDALTHAVEAYVGRATNRKTRLLAEHSVRLIRENLLRAYNDGDDLEARKNMQLAAYEAGLVITLSYVGYVHAIAHSIGGRYNTPHGRINATLLPVVLRAYGKSCTKKLACLARKSGVSTAKDNVQAAKDFIGFCEELNRQTGMPETIEIAEADIPTLAKTAAREANPLYPVPKLMSAKDLEKIYYTVKA